MNYLMVDSLIVFVVLSLIFTIGWWAGKGIEDIRAYAVGHKTFGSAALVLTFLATEVGGQGVVNIAGEAGTIGIIVIVAFLSFPISYIVQALWIAPKMTRFPQCMTMGDVMNTLYGQPIQVIVGLFSFIISICFAGAEIVMLGITVKSLLGINAQVGMLVGGLVLTFYVVHGGINSVTTTDVLQFLVLLVLLPVLAVTALQHVGGIKEVLLHIPSEQRLLWGHPRFTYYSMLFVSIAVFQCNLIDPALIQRMLMTKNARQLRNMFLTLAGLFTVLFLIFLLLGMAGHQLYPTLATTEVIPHMIKTLLPTGIRGLMMAGVIAVIMASADSYLHTAGVTLVHDVLKPLSLRSNFHIDEIRWVRYTTLIAGIFIIGLGLTHGENLYGLILTAFEFAIPLLVFPFFTGVLGLKPNHRAFYISSVVTPSIFVAIKTGIVHANIDLLPLICLLGSGFTFLGVHLIQHRGFVLVQHGHTATNKGYIWKPKRNLFISIVQKLIPTPKSIVRYSQRQVDKYGAPYLLFGTFCCINFTLPYFMWEHDMAAAYQLMLYLRVLGGLACGLLVVREKWPNILLPYLPTFWHLTLLYCLPFTSTVMFLLTQGSVEWLINVAITILFLIVLVDWLSFVILSILGVTLGLIFYNITIGPIDLQLDFSTGYLLVYQAIFATLIGLIFAQRKQQRFDKLATDNEALLATELLHKEQLLESFREKVRIIQTLKHAGIHNLLQVAKIIKDLRVKDQSTPLEAVTPHIESTLIPMALQLQALEHRATDYLRLQVDTHTIQHLLAQIQTQLSVQGKRKEIYYQVHSRFQSVECDQSRLVTLITNSISALRQQHEQNTLIRVVIEDTQLHYALPSVQADYIKKVAALSITITTNTKIDAPQDAYVVQMHNTSVAAPKDTHALINLENRRVIKAHYGCSSTEKNSYHYVIPTFLRDVRPADMDKSYMELGVAPTRADDHYEGAQEKEHVFLAAVQQRTTANIETVKTVLELIKWYHGPVRRQTGEPFYLHPLAVAQIVLDYNQNESTVLAALLHDTVEDTSMLLGHIETIFGKDTADIVDKVTHLESGQDSFYKIKLSAEENILMLLESGDDRAMYVKLADRMHNMRTIECKTTENQVRAAQETLQFFVPQAQRLGLHEATKELKQRCMEILGKQSLTPPHHTTT